MRSETPDRSGLPPLSQYATLFDGETDRIAGYTERKGSRPRTKKSPELTIGSCGAISWPISEPSYFADSCLSGEALPMI